MVYYFWLCYKPMVKKLSGWKCFNGKADYGFLEISPEYLMLGGNIMCMAGECVRRCAGAQKVHRRC
jgi:hypothetical protein